MSYDFLLNYPKINKQAACISDNPVLAAVISSYFNTPGEYFCLMDAPRLGRPDWTNEIIRRNNVLARLKPEKIILAGLSKDVIRAFASRLPSKRLIVINELSQVKEKLSDFVKPSQDGILECREDELVLGVLYAKYLKKELSVIKDATTLKTFSIDSTQKSQHKVILDDIHDMCPIITGNYAYSIGATVAIFPEPSKAEIEASYNDIYNIKTFKSTTRGKTAQRSLMSQQFTYESHFTAKKIEADFLTFITKGIPYGYFFPETPATHLFSYPDLGLAIFDNIYFASSQKETQSALILDPGFFKNSEVAVVKTTLEKANVFVKELSGDAAKVFNTGQYIQFYPYELLFICSHAGGMKGERVTAKFKDRKGITHEIVIEEALAFGLTGEGEGMKAKVEALHFRKFVELDGVNWSDTEGKKKINAGATITDFIKTDRREWQIIHATPINEIRECPAIKLTDNYYVPMMHVVASSGMPIIFNNACVSFQEFAGKFIFAGARAYIGTLNKVDTDDARVVAEYMFDKLSKKIPLPVLLWEAQRKVYSEPEQRVYIMSGCHFTNVLPSTGDKKENMNKKVKDILGSYLNKYFDTLMPEDVRNNIGRAIKLLGEVDRELSKG